MHDVVCPLMAGCQNAPEGAKTCCTVLPYTLSCVCLHLQLALAHTLLQWPYLTDMSLVSAIINIFYNDWGAAPKLPPAWLQLRRLPWLYFNLVITDSQV